MKPGPYLIWGVLGAAAIVAFAAFFMQGSPVTNEAIEDGNAFSTTAILGGRQNRNAFEAFVGGKANAVLGGVQLDLRGSNMGGNEARLDVFVMMGGVELWVPEDWIVVDQLNAVMGGVENKTRPPGSADANRLILSGTVLMGGLQIRN